MRTEGPKKGQMDGQTGMKKLIAAFRNFPNAPKIGAGKPKKLRGKLVTVLIRPSCTSHKVTQGSKQAKHFYHFTNII